jgi:hypothetical protein
MLVHTDPKRQISMKCSPRRCFFSFATSNTARQPPLTLSGFSETTLMTRYGCRLTVREVWIYFSIAMLRISATEERKSQWMQCSVGPIPSTSRQLILKQKERTKTHLDAHFLIDKRKRICQSRFMMAYVCLIDTNVLIWFSVVWSLHYLHKFIFFKKQKKKKLLVNMVFDS